MCANCAAQGSSVVIGAVAASRAVGRDAVYWLLPPRWRNRRHEPRHITTSYLTARSAPLRYGLALTSYVTLGVRWPQLLDPVLGPLYIVVAVWVVPNWVAGRVARLQAAARPVAAIVANVATSA